MDDLQRKPHSAAWAAPWAIGACLLWGSAFPGVRIALRHVTPLTFAGTRFVLAGLLLIPFCGRLSAIRSGLVAHWRLIAIVSLLQTTVLYATLCWGMVFVGGAKAAILVGSSPLVTALLAHAMIRDDRLTPVKIVAIVLGMAGVVILAITTRPWQRAGLAELGGMGLLIVAVLSGQLANIVISRHKGPFNPVLLNSAQMTLGGLVLLGAAAVTEPMPQSLPPREFLVALGYLATVSAVGFTIWFHLLQRVKVSQLNMWKFLLPVFGSALSWALLPGESPSLATVSGMVCVAAAVLWTCWQDARAVKKAKAAAEVAPSAMETGRPPI